MKLTDIKANPWIPEWEDKPHEPRLYTHMPFGVSYTYNPEKVRLSGGVYRPTVKQKFRRRLDFFREKLAYLIAPWLRDWY